MPDPRGLVDDGREHDRKATYEKDTHGDDDDLEDADLTGREHGPRDRLTLRVVLPTTRCKRLAPLPVRHV